MAWTALERRLARADNTRAALVLVERGEAPLGIVYASDALISGKVKVLATFPASSHDPIRYPLTIVKAQDSPEIQALFEYIAGEDAQRIFKRYGFARN